jgi:hypothetical protein
MEMWDGMIRDMAEQRLEFPTLEQVEAATWYRLLPSGQTAEQQKVSPVHRRAFRRSSKSA